MIDAAGLERRLRLLGGARNNEKVVTPRGIEPRFPA
jgi:hypothetical protein